jgi:hypothetical protein
MKKELEDSEKTNGMSPVQYLEQSIGANLIARIAFLWMRRIKLLAECGGCVHNPSTT